MTAQERPLKGAWLMTGLLFLFMLINFADKVVVGLAARPIMQELQLTPQEFGLLGSSFFFLFAVSAVVVGFLTNRIHARRTLLAMAIVWSLVQFPMLATVNLEVLMACRIILGAGEGPAAPVATHAIYKWFPDSLRGLPTAIIAQGSALGVIVAVPTLNWIIVHHSWHWAFGALGVAGLVWAVLWLAFGREGTLVDRPASPHGNGHVPYRYLITCPSIVAVSCTCFATYWGLSLGLTWFTSYLIQGLGYSQAVAGNLTILPWIFGLCVVLSGGWLSQRLTRAGVSSRIARGIFPAATVILGGCLMPLVGSMPSPAAKLAVLVIGSAIGSTIYVVIPMIVSELTPQSQRAGMLAITNSFVTVAGVLAPLVMGNFIQNAASPVAGYEHGYVIMGLLMIAGGLIGVLFIRPEADRARLVAHAARTAGMRPAQA
ncbi:MFS transporter [Enhydrobacter aerosaccus]|uniref:MFS transporter n=1 Tax=Enhydrobacter aerosaccus TaxID=225324 RepID=UPI001C43C62E|nr:MFS transporter [Enhydrobacter aerosaccus]